MVDKNIKITREEILSSSYETDENLLVECDCVRI